MTEGAILFGTWFAAMISGAICSMGILQALTGRRTHLFTPRGIEWSFGEVKLFGVAGAIYTLALAVYVLLGSLAIAANLFTWDFPSTIAFLPVMAIWLAFQGLMRQRHRRRWPFGGQVDPG